MMEGRERVVSRLDWNRRPHNLAFSGKALSGRRFNRWRRLDFSLILIIVHKANLMSAQVSSVDSNLRCVVPSRMCDVEGLAF